MTMESPLRLLGSSGAGYWPVGKDTAAYSSSTSNVAAEELGLLLKGHVFHGNENVAGPGRSGSAPPSMEGSRAAFDILKGQQMSSSETSMENLSNAAKSCKSEEQLRAHPAYLAYYCSNINLNPRLPPPLISRENRQLMQRIGGFGDNRRMRSLDDSSKASFDISQTSLSTHKEESEDDKSPRLETSDWTKKNMDLSGKFISPLPGRHKSLVDLIQEDFPRTPSPVYNNQSRPSSNPAEEQATDLDACINTVHEPESSVVRGHPRTPIVSGHLVGTVPNGDVVVASSTGRTVNLNHGLYRDSSTDNAKLGSGVLNSAASGSNLGSTKNEMDNLKVSSGGHRNQQTRQNFQFGLPPQGLSSQPHSGPSLVILQGTRISQNATDHLSNGQSKLSSTEVQPVLQSAGITPSLYATAAAYGTSYYPNLQPSNLYPPHMGVGGYALSNTLMPPLMTGYPPQSALPLPFDNPVNPNFNARASGVSAGGNFVPGVDLQQFYKIYGQLGLGIQPSLSDPLYMPYFQHPFVDAYTAASQHGAMLTIEGTTGSPVGSYDPQKRPSSAAYSPDQRPQFPRTGSVNYPTSRKGGNVSPNYYGSNPNISVLMQYPNSLFTSPLFQGPGTNFPRRRNDIRFPFNSARTAGTYSGWQRQRGREKVDDPKSHSFLEELKSSKACSYELSDIAAHIVEFSCDQHGSRFIQQKLETCSVEEKASVFREVLPHASTLMSDVFGNYVIQKFFEHGSPEQRKELANKLVGRMLSLSLQMYGCRVIQKALEVIGLDQQTQLVQELDGHVMQCVRDQNGNHVIQKCIECIPAEKIGFIISAFRGEVATLSKHPYGCRVIQRVLEHCTDESHSEWIVDEILQSACQLAQDQYGNYVTQHVLERGKAHERSHIISKLAGQVVQMSQHKFASNVIEKCLEHGDAAERELLIEEIVGQTEGNDNLLVMMKDQFANYVVQKILDTCSDKQREVLVSRIKVHLQALRKYTYGKHIVGRVEQLWGEEPHASAES